MRIRSSNGWVPLNVRELWEHRELLYFLAWRDVRVRYKQTLLGIGWAILKPLLTVFMFTIIFDWLMHVRTDGLPYPLLSICAVVPWQLFSYTLTGSSQSLVAEQHLLTKVYFPRLIVPLSKVLSGMVDFLITIVLLFVLLGYFHVIPNHYTWTFPLFMTIGVIAALGMGLWFSALNVRYRDVGHALPFLTQMWFFATPIVYPSSLIPESWRLWYGLNPMVTVVEGFRWAFFGTTGLTVEMSLVSLAVSGAVFVSGLYYFRLMEETFADVV
ncbi:MAG: ABC transporter permease [Nitrospira sp.]|nr:ABC transporter permease [Nitrospira sp.]